MERHALVLVLALMVPLALYGIPYSYAVTTSSSYVVKSSASAAASSFGITTSSCNPGDYATGGSILQGTSSHSGITGFPSQLVVYWDVPTVAGVPAQTGEKPDSWIGEVFNTDSVGAHSYEVTVVCQTPIAVAGVGVPEFGSLYVAIALGAMVYFVLSRRFTRRPSLLAQA